MQRFITTIGYALFAGLLLVVSPLTVFAQPHVDQPFEGETASEVIDHPCKVTSATFYALGAEGYAPLQIKTAYCTGWELEISAKHIKTFDAFGSWNTPGNHSFIPVDPTGSTDVLITRGEAQCSNGDTPDCKVKLTLTPRKKTGQQVQLGTPFTVPTTGTYNYNCDTNGACNTTKVWSWTTEEILATTCSILSAQFENSKDTGYVGEADGNTHYITSKNSLIISTKHCSGKPIYVSLVEGEGTVKASDAVPVVDNKKIIVPATESVRIRLRAGEDNCNSNDSLPDCVYRIVAGPEPFVSTDALGTSYYSFGKPHGRLAYECEGLVCADDWVYEGDNGDTDPADPNAVAVTDGGTLGDPNSACIDKASGKPIEGCYELYGGLGELLKGKLDLVDNKFDVLKKDSLGGLLNGFIAIAIGIGGVLAVGMIMYEGFLYMKSDNPNTKTETKSRILKTLLGFLLLLTIFVILRTINPDLLNLNPSISAITLEVAEGQDPNEVLDQQIATNPNLAKIYAESKGHWRDGGRVNPDKEEARKALANSIQQSNLTDLSSSGITFTSKSGKFVEKTVAPKIVAFNTALKTAGVAMIVTEAFKPTTYRHYAACQYTGTCIDVDVVPFNTTKVATLISEAQKNGLIAVWETTDKGNYNDLIKAGVPQSSIILFKGESASHITGDHASVYDYQ